MSDADQCWVCDAPEVVYVDVLGLGWCREHWTTLYWENPYAKDKDD